MMLGIFVIQLGHNDCILLLFTERNIQNVYANALCTLYDILNSNYPLTSSFNMQYYVFKVVVKKLLQAIMSSRNNLLITRYSFVHVLLCFSL